MSILFGILLYVLCIAWFCALTGINRLDESKPNARHAREPAVSNAAASVGQVPAREANG